MGLCIDDDLGKSMERYYGEARSSSQQWHLIETAPKDGVAFGWSEECGHSVIYLNNRLDGEGSGDGPVEYYFNGDVYHPCTHWMTPMPPNT